MRRLILALIFLLAGAANAFGQSTTVSGNVTDSGAQAWAGGTYQFQFTPNPQFPTGPYTWTGGTLNQVISGTLDGSGNYSVSIPSNTAISPQGSTWILQVTPNATSASFSTPKTTITGATQTLNATPPAITTPPTLFARAYADSEITGAVVGSQYFNVTSSLVRVCTAVTGLTCTTWANVGSGAGGSVTGSGVANQIAFWTGATAIGGNTNLTFVPSTLSLTLTGGGSSFDLLSAGPSNLNAIGVDGTPGGGVTIAADEPGAGQFRADALTSIVLKSLGGVNLGNTGEATPLIFIGGTSGSTTLSTPAVSAEEVDIGAVAGGNAILGLLGTTSGKATFTAPSVAGTTTNPVVSSNAISAPLFNSAGDGVHAGLVSLVGNTTAPAIAANTVNLLGPSVTTFTAYGLQYPSTAPSGTQYLGCGTPVSSVSTCSFSTPVGTGANTALSNLAAVAINAALLPGTTNTIALGSAADVWTNLFSTALNCGIVGTTSCVISLNGSTSGTATITAPAVAGTTTNPFLFSNNIVIPRGTTGAPGLQFNAAASGQGIWGSGDATSVYIQSDATNVLILNGEWIAPSNGIFGWCSSDVVSCPALDTRLSRSAAGVVSVDTTTTGNSAGTIKATSSNLGVAGTSVGTEVYSNATSGSITITPPTGALGSVTLTLPTTTGTIATTTQAFPVTVTGGVSGAIPCFTSTTTEAAGTLLTANVLPKGGGAGVCPSNSLVTDSGSLLTYTGVTGISAPIVQSSVGKQIISGADYTNSTTTPSTVFSWTLPVTAAAQTYRYTCDIMWESTNTTLVGPVFGVNISAAPTQLTASASVQNTLAGADVNGYLSNATTGSQTLVTSAAAGVTSTNYWAKIWGTIEGATTAGSTFIINAASTSSTTATLNIRRGSGCTLN